MKDYIYKLKCRASRCGTEHDSLLYLDDQKEQVSFKSTDSHRTHKVENITFLQLIQARISSRTITRKVNVLLNPGFVITTLIVSKLAHLLPAPGEARHIDMLNVKNIYWNPLILSEHHPISLQVYNTCVIVLLAHEVCCPRIYREINRKAMTTSIYSLKQLTRMLLFLQERASCNSILIMLLQ